MISSEPISDADLLGLVEYVLDSEPHAIRLDDVLSEIGWDSLAIVEFIAVADSRVAHGLDAERVARSETVRDLRDLLVATS